jgi:hypothetical protein
MARIDLARESSILIFIQKSAKEGVFEEGVAAQERLSKKDSEIVNVDFHNWNLIQIVEVDYEQK